MSALRLLRVFLISEPIIICQRGDLNIPQLR